MGDLLVKFQQHLKKEYPFLQPANCQLLLAVSGGVDSVVLTHLFVQSSYHVVIAHCNFQLRGQESNRDEQFVRQLAAKYNIPVHVKQFDTETYAQQQKLSIQEAARKLRYKWFQSLVSESSDVHSPLSIVHRESVHSKKKGKSVQPHELPVNRSAIHNRQSAICNPQSAIGTAKEEPDESFAPNQSAIRKPQSAIVTAHHANDNIETLLINLFRGTGIGGLHGIPARQGNILRPLLFAKREEILAYAKANSLGWVEDSSNASEKYTRNFIRLQLLPAAKEIFSNAEDNLLQNIERFKEAEILYTQAITLHKSKLLEKKGNEWHIPVLKLQKVNPQHTIIWEIIKDFGFSSPQVPEIVKLFDAGNGSYVASATSRIIKNRNWLIIAPLQTGEAQNIIIEQGDKKIVFEDGVLEIEKSSIVHGFTGSTVKGSPFTPQDSSLTNADSRFMASVDASQIKYPLLLRKWKQGDYFYPLGMQKKKKLGKFFIDQKLSKTAKEKVWVLECDKKIVWVVGLRIDDRFKLTPSTQKSLRINFISY